MTARLFRKHSLFCVLVPKARLAAAIPRMRPEVIVTIGRESFATTLLPHSARSYRLVVPAAFVRERGLRVGDTLALSVRPDRSRSAPRIPPELLRGLRELGLTEATFRSLTVAYQREAVRYVEEGKGLEARQRRAESFARRIADFLVRRRE